MSTTARASGQVASILASVAVFYAIQYSIPAIADQGASTEVMLLSHFLSFLITVLCPWHLSPQSTAEERVREWLSNLSPATQLSQGRSMIRMQLSLILSPEFTLQDYTACLLARETVAECFSRQRSYEPHQYNDYTVWTVILANGVTIVW